MTEQARHTLEEIEPTRLYSFADAAALIPSPRRGKRTNVRTLHRHRQSGLLKAIRRPCPAGTQWTWYVLGSEILRYVGIDGPTFTGRTPSQRKKAVDEAIKRYHERFPKKEKQAKTKTTSTKGK